MGRPYAGRAIGRLRPVPVAPGGGGPVVPPDPNIDLDPARGAYNVAFAGNRIPQFIVDLQWRNDMQAAIAANDPYMTKLKFRADTALSAPWYGDGGIASAIMYQITGTASYAAHSLSKLTENLNHPLKQTNDGNDCREHFAIHCVQYDWLYAAMTSQQRTDLMARLWYWGEYAVGENVALYVGGIRTGDSDAVVGYYGGLLLLSCLDVPENTRRGEWLSKNEGSTDLPPTGGVNSTGDNRNTVRNTVYNYFNTSFAGGCWGEGSEYNSGTSVLWLNWYSAAKSAMLTDHFPEITAYLDNAAKWFVQDLYPGLSNRRHWSDDENPRDPRWHSQYEVAMCVAGLLTRAGSATAPLAMYHAAQTLAAKPDVINSGLIFRAPLSRYNPLATAAVSYNAMPLDMRVAVGHHAVNFGAFGGDRVWLFAASATGVDHASAQSASAQVWYDNELTLDTNVSYAGSYESNSNNAVLFCGLSCMEAHGPVRSEGVAGVWGCQTSATQGSRYFPGFWAPPEPFVIKAESRMVTFKENGWLIVVAREDLNVKDPSTLGNPNNYVWNGDQAKVNAALARNERVARIWHMPVPATDVTGGFKWTTGGGHDCYVYHPVGLGSKIHYNEKTSEAMLYNGAGIVAQSELKYQTRLVVPVQDVNLTVQVYMVGPGGGTPPAISSASAGAITVGTKVVTFNTSSTTVS